MNTATQRTPTGDLVLETLGERVRAHLAGARFRKARDEAKELCKRDRAQFLPLLVAANVGLAREMIDAGFGENARTVIDYLKTIASKEVVAELELRLAIKADAGSVDAFPVALKLAEALGRLSEDDRVEYADRLVVAFAPLPEEEVRTKALAADLAAVLAALEALGSSDWASAQERCAAVGRDSVFRYWRLFVKGVVAFHGGDHTKALAAFERLPAKSVPGRAAAAYVILMGGEAEPPKEPTLAAMAELVGEPSLGKALTQAQSAWQKGDVLGSYQVWRRAVPKFPSGDLSLVGLLSELHFNAVGRIVIAQYETHGRHFYYLMIDRVAKSPFEEAAISRMLALSLAKVGNGREVAEYWSRFIGKQKVIRQWPSHIESLAWSWIGKLLAVPCPDCRGKNAHLRLTDEALQYLQMAIDLDAQNLEARIALCDAYQALGRFSERDRWLDLMVANFPDATEVVVRAGDGCLSRKSFQKAATYFQIAHSRDPLNPLIADKLGESQIRWAALQYRSRRVARGRKILEQNQPILVLQPGNHIRGIWCHTVLHSVLEKLWGNAVFSGELYQQALRLAPSPQSAAFFAQLAWLDLTQGLPQDSPYYRLCAEIDHLPLTPAEGLSLASCFLHWNRFGAAEYVGREKFRIQSLLQRLARQPMPSGVAQQFLDLIAPEPVFRMAALQILGGQDAGKPYFRVQRVRLQSQNAGDSDAKRTELNQILADATQQGDDHAARLARETLSQLDHDDNWDDPAEHSQEWDGPPDLFGNAGPAMQELESGLDEVIDSMKYQDPEDLRRIRPKDMPPEILEALIELARRRSRPNTGPGNSSERRRQWAGASTP